MSIRYARIAIEVIDADAASQLVTYTCAGHSTKHAVYWNDLTEVASADSGQDPMPAKFPDKGTKLAVWLSWGHIHRESAAKRFIEVDPNSFKYPERLADTSVAYTTVPFRITNLVVSGFELVSGEYRSATLDLADPRLAALAQTITYGEQSRDVELALSAAAIDTFNQGAGA